MSAHQANFPVRTMCRVLGVSHSGFYDWQHRGPSKRAIADAVLSERIRTIHADSHQTYGMPRIRAELAEHGVHVGGKRIVRLMRAARLRGVTYVPTWAGFVYLAIVLDVWSRRVVGWSIGERMTTDLVLAALNMALAQRKPDEVIHHSDQGS
jgi:putative transposase